MLDIKDAHFTLVADDLAFLAARDGNIPLGKQRSDIPDKAVNWAITIDKDRDRRQSADRIFHLSDASGQPLRQRCAR